MRLVLGRGVITTSRCEAKGTCGFYFERIIGIKAMEGYGEKGVWYDNVF